jgi:uncharacterized protein YjbJ (UPF0337 family)
VVATFAGLNSCLSSEAATGRLRTRCPAGVSVVVTEAKGGSKMATEDKAAHKVTELKGQAKEAVGDVTDDQDLKAEGQADQAEGNIKQAGDKVKDAGSKIKDAVTDD